MIQENTTGAVESIGSIRGVIDKVSHISSVIATAVEEQSATTNEMSRNVAEAAKGAGEISGNIAGVAEAAQSTSNTVGEAQKATEHMAGIIEFTKSLITKGFAYASGAVAKGVDTPHPVVPGFERFFTGPKAVPAEGGRQFGEARHGRVGTIVLVLLE